MKRGTDTHPKTLLLASELSMPRYAVVGLLESLWHFTARYTPSGNVGKFDNKLIAVSIDWDRDPDELIAALVRTGWLDEDPTHRLIVHHWPSHCDDATHMTLARAQEYFADGTEPKRTRLGQRERETADAFYSENRTTGAPDSPPEHTARTRRAHGVNTKSSPPSHPIPSPAIPSHPTTIPSHPPDADNGGGGGNESDGGEDKASPNGRLRTALARAGIVGNRLGLAADRLTGTGRDEATLCRFVDKLARDTSSAKSPGAAASSRILDPPPADLHAEIDALTPRRIAPAGASDITDAQRQAERVREQRLCEQRARAEGLGDEDFNAALAEVSKCNPAVAAAAGRLTPEKRRRSNLILAAVGQHLEQEVSA